MISKNIYFLRFTPLLEKYTQIMKTINGNTMKAITGGKVFKIASPTISPNLDTNAIFYFY